MLLDCQYCLPVLVLSTAVVCVEGEPLLTKTVVAEIVVKEAYHTISPLPHADGFINKIVDLLIIT